VNKRVAEQFNQARSGKGAYPDDQDQARKRQKKQQTCLEPTAGVFGPWEIREKGQSPKSWNHMASTWTELLQYFPNHNPASFMVYVGWEKDPTADAFDVTTFGPNWKWVEEGWPCCTSEEWIQRINWVGKAPNRKGLFLDLTGGALREEE
jgi:hypothetical protein